MPEYIPTTKQIYRARVGVVGQYNESWTCGHEHLNLRDAQQCAEAEIGRRERESTRRERIRLPGIHADIVLEHMPSHPAGDSGVEMTIAQNDPPLGDYGHAEIELSVEGIRQLINALAEVAGLPYNP